LHAATGRFVALLVWLVFTPAILRSLGPQAFGVWALFYVLTGYFAALDFGLVQSTLRYVAAAREKGADAEAGAYATLGVLGYLLLAILWFLVALGAGNAAIAWLRIPATEVQAAHVAVFAGAGVFVLAGVANVTIAVLQGYGRFDLANLMVLAMASVQTVGFLLALRLHSGFNGFVVAVVVAWSLTGLLGLGIVPLAAPRFRWATPMAIRAHVREMWRFGGPVQITNLLGVLHSHADKILLSRFVALASIVPYELGSRVSLTVCALPQLMLMAVLPEASAIFVAGDRDRLRLLYERGSRHVMTAVAVTLAPVLGAADRIFAVWLGPGHGDAALVTRVVTSTIWFTMTTGMGTTLGRAIARTELETWYATVTVAVHLTLSWLLLPRLGLPGALIGYAAGGVCGVALFFIVFARALGWSLGFVLASCGRPLVATLGGSTAGWLVDRLLPVSAGGALGWLLLCLSAVAASATAFALVLATQYLRWSDVRTGFAAVVRTLRVQAG
jgi:O-antigen/teichoic acid export membrane protein